VHGKSYPKKVLITGATGGIGQSLTPFFLKNGYEVQAIARDLEYSKKLSWFNEVDFFQFDLKDGLDKLDINPDISVVHLAWQGLPNYKSDFHVTENLPINYNFIKSLIERGVKHIMITGSCAEYGMQNGEIKSSTPSKPNTQYAKAKDTLHKKLRILQDDYQFELKWARLFYIYGEGGKRNNSILKQLDKAIENNEKIFNMSGGEQLRDYLAIDEVAEQLFFLFENYKNGTFNICSGQPISIKQLVEDHIKKRKSKIVLNTGFHPYLDFEPMEFWGEKDINPVRK
tara:strand:+ start:86 stop:940 length:855 start_codon:yes stop_codon:yes gene_type:complete